MTDTYETILEAVIQNFRRCREPHAAAQGMIRAVRVLMQSRSRAEIETLAADQTAWIEAVTLYVRAGSIGLLDALLSRQILPLLFDAAVEEEAEIQAQAAPRPKGKHFTAKIAERMGA